MILDSSSSSRNSSLVIQYPSVQLTENQKKVIQDKYLKGSESVESWLAGVARNIALAELLYHPNSSLWGLFDGVRVFKKEFLNPIKDSPAPQLNRYCLFHSGIHSSSERELNFLRFISNCNLAVEKYSEAKQCVGEWENRFYDFLSSWSFLPNSPTLMNAGRDLQQLSACYVLPVEDSMEGVTNALQAQALIHKSGGGTGFSFERMRPQGDRVKSTEGVASGVISFMQVFDRMTAVVKQGGNRRGANMGVLPYWHPEIKEFINLKKRPGVMENFNISVTVDDKFFEAVENNQDFDFINPRTKQTVGKQSARELFDLIIENAWRTGDPGLIFIDRINNTSSNPTPVLGKIESTNPCGEQPLLPNEPCNLGSINLFKFVKGDLGQAEIDWDHLKKAIYLGVRFLEDVIDVNNYPLPEMEVLAKTNRRIGIGIMGWAETLVMLGIAYDSEKAIQTGQTLMKFFNEAALEASEELANERGVFPNWRNSVYDPKGSFYRGVEKRPRNCARTTIAPTGTIGLAAGLQGSGIEPFYGIAYTRYSAKALEAIKNNQPPEPKDIYFEVNPLFKEIAKNHNFFGLNETELWKKIEKNKKSVKGISEIPANIQALFVTAHDVSIEFHVRIQSAFQEYVDNAVSKTINLPHQATLEDVRHSFILAHKLGCKGITIYRDGSKQQQVLNLQSQTRKNNRKERDLSSDVFSEYYEIKTGYGPIHVHIDFDHTGPYRLFSGFSEVGTELSGLTSSLGVIISKYLEEGGNANGLIKHLESVKGDRPFGLGKAKVHSISHAIAIALKTHLQKHGWLEDSDSESFLSPEFSSTSNQNPAALELWNLTHLTEQCPKCLSSNVTYSAACNGPVCHDCGFSECN